MVRWIFGKWDQSVDYDDPYDILRNSAGSASRRFEKHMLSGRRPSMRLVDRLVGGSWTACSRADSAE
jgi:hypothetical protein